MYQYFDQYLIMFGIIDFTEYKTHFGLIGLSSKIFFLNNGNYNIIQTTPQKHK